MVQDGNLALGHLPPTKSLLNPAGAPTFYKQVLSTHLVITIQLVPEKDTDKVTIEFLQCWVNNMRTRAILLTKISLQNFSKHKQNDNLNIQNISRETLLFIIFAYHAPFVPFTDHPFHFVATLVLIFLSGFPSVTRFGYFFFLVSWYYFFCCFCFQENRRRGTFLNFVTTCVTINWRYKICKKLPRSFPGTSPNTLCGICIVFRHFKFNFLLVLQWLLCFEQIDPTCFVNQFSNGFSISLHQEVRCECQKFFLGEKVKCWYLRNPAFSKAGTPAASNIFLELFLGFVHAKNLLWFFLRKYCCFSDFRGN